jgi:hypothetical protein
MKSLTDRNGKEIRRGTVVRYKSGWVQVSAVSVGKRTVNLAYVWDISKIYHKGVSVDEIFEDGDAQYEQFSKSETYMCM